MTADRPATEPRTEAGRALVKWAPTVLPDWPWLLYKVLAIEAEAAQGAALLDARLSEGAAPQFPTEEGAESHERFHPTWDCIDCTHSWLGSHSDTGCHVEGCGCTEPNPYHRPAAAQGAAPQAEEPPDDRTCLTHPRNVPHDWNHRSYEGTWLCHCTVCGIIPNRAAPRAEGRPWHYADDCWLASRPSDERVPEEER